MPTPIPPPLTQWSGRPANARARGVTRFQLASSTTAVVLVGLALLLVGALVVLSLLAHDPQDDLAGEVMGLAVAVPFAAVGFVVAVRQPQNSIGWILLASALCFLLTNVGTAYSIIDYRLHGGALPFGWVAVSFGFLWIPWLMLMALPVLLFPAGKAPSVRWRWSLWAYLILGGVGTITTLADGAIIGLGRHVQILLDGSPRTSGHGGAAAASLAIGGLLALGITVTWIVRLLASYWGATGDSRQQLKWLLGGGAVTVAAVVLSLLVPSPSSGSSGIWQVLIGGVLPFGIAALPIGLGIGILKYRLYDVDRLISRTLSYAIVTGLLVGVYVGLVTLATRVLPFSSPLGIAASTLAAVALFNPLRRRVQRLVDRRFNRARYDAEGMVAAFARRVRDDVDLEAVSSEFVRAVQSSVEPAHISLWLRPTGSSR